MLKLETSSTGLTADAEKGCCKARECLDCCAATGKQTANNPSARTSAPLDMRKLKTKSQQTPAKTLRKRTQFVKPLMDSVAASLCEAPPSWAKCTRAASLTERRLEILHPSTA